MDILSLQEIGLNKNEAIIYSKLVHLGKVTAGELIKKTEFHRNIVYDNLEKLIDKGLISFVPEGKVKIFQLANPEMITEYLEKQQKSLNARKQIAVKIKKEIQKKYSLVKNEQGATIYRGVNGVKLVMKEILESGENYISLGAPIESNKIMGELYWENFAIKQRETKTHARLLFNESLKEWKKQVSHKFNKIKYLTQKSESLTQTIVCRNKVVIVVWSEKPIITVINDIDVAKSYSSFFNFLWKSAKS